MTLMKVAQVLRPWLMGLAIGVFAYIAASDPAPIYIGVMSGLVAMMLYSAIAEVEQKIPKPKWPAIYITREQLEDHPDIIADHLRVTQALRRYIENQEQTAAAQWRTADDLDNGVFDETLGKIDVDKNPPQAYRMAARTNKRNALYLRRILELAEDS